MKNYVTEKSVLKHFSPTVLSKLNNVTSSNRHRKIYFYCCFTVLQSIKSADISRPNDIFKDIYFSCQQS